MATNSFTNGPIVYKDAAGVPNTVTLGLGLGNVSIDPAIQHAALHGAGRIDPTWMGVGQHRPVLNFTCFDIKKIIESFNGQQNGFAIKGVDTPSSTPLDFYFTKIEDVKRKAGSTHFKGTINKGLFLPMEMSWTQGPDPVSINCQVIALEDVAGATDAVVLATNQALPAIATSTPFFGGIATVEGVDLDDEILGVTVSWNLDVEVLNTGHNCAPIRADVLASRKQVRIQTKNVLQLSTHTMVGKELTTPAVIYFAKGDSTNCRVAGATAQHCSLTINHGQLHVGAFSGDEGASKSGEIVIEVEDDLTNDPFVWAFNATLP